MSFPRYPEYKDSGVEWLGDVPAHWNLTPLKYVVNLRSGGTPSKANLTYWDGDVPWASSKDLKSEVLFDTQDHITQSAIDEGAAVLVPAGSLLIVVRGMILIHTFPVVKALVPMAINQDLKALAPSHQLDVDFLAWLLRGASKETLGRIDEAAHGTKVLRLDTWTLIVLPIPPLPEQTKIIAFLDRETTKIDALVAEQRRLMSLLKEKRQAVISHAVTKGLNSDVLMKPSGIEWLGDVPAQWDVRKLHSLARLESGHTPSRQRPEYWIEEACVIPWFTLADVGFLRDDRNTVIESTSQKISQVGIENSSARLLPPGTVLLSRTASVGFSGITKISLAVSQDFAAWICSPRIHPRYLLYCLRAMKPEFQRLMMGSTHQTIYMPDIEAFRVPIPLVIEQIAIANYIENETYKLDILAAEIQRAIDLLKERRTALISAAVTGQIDVREAFA